MFINNSVIVVDHQQKMLQKMHKESPPNFENLSPEALLEKYS